MENIIITDIVILTVITEILILISDELDSKEMQYIEKHNDSHFISST